MLVALLNDERIDADVAERRNDYRCPRCKHAVILKRYLRKVDHFAHKPPTTCTYGRGESEAHKKAKIMFRDEWRRRGEEVFLEMNIKAGPSIDYFVD